MNSQAASNLLNDAWSIAVHSPGPVAIGTELLGFLNVRIQLCPGTVANDSCCQLWLAIVGHLVGNNHDI